MAILMGWKEIAKECGGVSVRTIKKKARKHKMPITYLDRRPCIAKKDLEEWWEKIKTGG